MATQMLSLRATTAHLRGATMTLGIGLTLALIYLYQASLRGEAQDLFILRWAAVPMEIAEQTDLAPTVPFPIFFTTLTSVFLHATWLHLLGNLLLLGLFGPYAERALGPWAALAIFLCGGTLGAAAQAYAHADSLVNLVGASGACAALMGATLVVGRPPFALRLVFVAWLAMQVAEFVASFDSYDWIEGGMAVWSHAGGLVVGLLAGLIAFGAQAAYARK